MKAMISGSGVWIPGERAKQNAKVKKGTRRSLNGSLYFIRVLNLLSVLLHFVIEAK
jgi:hypothetical protein